MLTDVHDPPDPLVAAEERRAVAAARRRRLRRGVRLALLRHRRLLAAGCVAGAVALGLRTLAPPAPVTVPVTVAARDLPAGTTTTSDDVRTARWPAGSAPDGLLAADAATGRRLSGPVRAGEPLTDARVVGPSVLAGLPAGWRAVTLTVPAADAALVRPGDEVDVLAAGGTADAFGTQAATARVVGRGVLVVGVTGAGDDGGGLLGAAPAGGASLVVAADLATVTSLAGAAAGGSLSVALRAPSTTSPRSTGPAP